MAKPVAAARGTPPRGEMPHGGYRPFDIAACRRFSGFPLYVARRWLEPGRAAGSERHDAIPAG
jgi:hypothetical protein